MLISFDYGHGVSGDRGAEGILNEENEIRRYAPYCVNALIRAGHKCVDCTPKGKLSLSDSLAYRVNKANQAGSELHICFHVNAYGDPGAHGAEIEVDSDRSAAYAKPILNKICSLGFISRGVNRPELYVTRHTNMACVLVEPFFCTSPQDCNLYNPQALGEAIAQGILDNIGNGDYVSPQPAPVNNADDVIRDFQHVCNKIGIEDDRGQQLAEDNLAGQGGHTQWVINHKIDIGKGSTGEMVRLIQRRLIELGFSCGPCGADASFGNATLAAIKQFQASRGLDIDGNVGPMTMRALLGL